MRTLSFLAVATIASALSLGGVSEARSVRLCKKHYRPMKKGEKLLSCKYRGGKRPTKQLFGKRYLTVVGTCWDFDVVALKRCGCRLFERTSLCCRKGSTKRCNWRIGKTRLVDCKRYKQPKYGLSGNKGSDYCRNRKNAKSCFKRKDLLFGPGQTIGPCNNMPHFTCKRGRPAWVDYRRNKCGPTPEDCGCKLVPECSKPKHVACYDKYKKDKEAIACFWRESNGYKADKCYKALLEARAAKK